MEYGTLSKFAVALPLVLFSFNQDFVSNNDYPHEADSFELNSNNFFEYSSIQPDFLTYSAGSRIINSSPVDKLDSRPIIESQLDIFLASIEDGTIFDGIGPEVWSIAERIVKNNPKITNYI